MSDAGRRLGGLVRSRQPGAKAKACAAIGAYNARRHLMPKCGAACPTTGEPCRNVAMANERCYRHGGKTPKGKNWHRVQWPTASAPNAVARADRKAMDLARAARKRAKRLEKMSPERRAEHIRWQKTHQPGDPAERARRRAERRQSQEARALIEKPRPAEPMSDEEASLRTRLAAAESRLAELHHQAELEIGWTTGVFT